MAAVYSLPTVHSFASVLSPWYQPRPGELGNVEHFPPPHFLRQLQRKSRLWRLVSADLPQQWRRLQRQELHPAAPAGSGGWAGVLVPKVFSPGFPHYIVFLDTSLLCAPLPGCVPVIRQTTSPHEMKLWQVGKGLSSLSRGTYSAGCAQNVEVTGPGVKGHSLLPPLAAPAVRALLLEAWCRAVLAGSGPQGGTLARIVGLPGGLWGFLAW